MDSTIVLLAALGGVIPALLWLFFWLMEDRCEPEPKRYILLSFLIGGFFVLPVLYLEKYFIGVLAGTSLILMWASIEELAKFLAAYLGALRTRAFDEPLDAVIYVVTAALGFSAVENTLFLITPLQQGDLLRTIVTGDLRFIGATLLHTLSSATVGIALALSYYKPAAVRCFAALAGVILAILLHALFNFFILQGGGGSTFYVFLFIWLGVVGLLFAIEKVKQPARDYC